MQEKAFVFISVEDGRLEEVMLQLQKFKDITELNKVIGMWDLVIKIKGPTIEALAQMVVKIINKIPGVIDSRFLPIVE